MKKGLTILIIAVVIVGGYFLLKDKQEVQNNTPVKLGIILPLSGEISSLGENAKNGAMLAYNELPTDTQKNIKLIFEDDKFDVKNTVSAFNKLVSIDKVSAIVCFTSTPCAAVASLADEQKIPLIAVASAPVQENRQYVVRLELSTTLEGETLAQYISSKKYLTIASVVAVQDGVQSAYASLINDPYVSSHLGVSESVRPDLKDFRSVIAKILVGKPDVIVIGLLPGPAGIFAKQARELGYKSDFVGFNFIEGDETLQAAQGAIDGIVYTQATEPTSSFIDKYQRTYSKSPGPGSAHLYDAVKILSNGVKNNINGSEAVITYLKSIKDFSGALGKYSSIPDGEFNIPVVLKTVKDNKFVKLEQ